MRELTNQFGCVGKLQPNQDIILYCGNTRDKHCLEERARQISALFKGRLVKYFPFLEQAYGYVGKPTAGQPIHCYGEGFVMKGLKERAQKISEAFDGQLVKYFSYHGKSYYEHLPKGSGSVGKKQYNQPTTVYCPDIEDSKKLREGAEKVSEALDGCRVNYFPYNKLFTSPEESSSECGHELADRIRLGLVKILHAQNTQNAQNTQGSRRVKVFFHKDGLKTVQYALAHERIEVNRCSWKDSTIATLSDRATRALVDVHRVELDCFRNVVGWGNRRQIVPIRNRSAHQQFGLI